MAPSATGPVLAPTTSTGKRPASKFGDHGDFLPSTHRDPIITTVATAMAPAQGRRQTLRSPLLDRSGKLSKKAPTTSGPTTMTTFSRLGGRSASTAKYQSRYQSGRGDAVMLLGSGGASSGGGPTRAASRRMPKSMAPANTKSRQSASGQK